MTATRSNNGVVDMAYLVADPEMMTSAASDLAAIGSNVSTAHVVAPPNRRGDTRSR